MQISITGRHYEISPGLRSYLDQRIDRLTRFTDRIHSAQVILKSEKHGNSAELVLRAEGKEFNGKDEHADMMSAVDGAYEKMEKQLRRFKDRRKSSRKNGAKLNGSALSGTLRILNERTVGHGTLDHEILKVEDYPIQNLTVDEAILKLEQTEENFVVFANERTDLIHIVYKGSDGHYGVINLHATH